MLTAENGLKLPEDCTRYTPDKIFSPYGLVKPFGEEDSGSHEPLADEGGSAINALNYAAYVAFGNPSLECSSKDKTMPDFADNDDGVFGNIQCGIRFIIFTKTSQTQFKK